MQSNRPSTSTAPQTQRRVSVNPFAAVLQDYDDDDDGSTGTIPFPVDSLTRPLASKFIHGTKSDEADKDNDDVDDDDSSQISHSSTNNTRRVRPPRPSMAIVASKSNTSQQQQRRRRRRSSARFLQLSKAARGYIDDEHNDDDEDDDDVGQMSSNSQKGTLQEMYQTAIRMNAENKINTTNSWNLHIIDQMDAFLSLNDGNETNSSLRSNAQDQMAVSGDESNGTTVAPTETSTRVNFTKASCTLDASVKIYSYRVDDVHLTSYKVLANLNRTQNNKNDKLTPLNDDNNEGDGTDNRQEKNVRKESNKVASGNTLEMNVGTFPCFAND
jgi:condensin complex subunit 2